jgi:hypothetical protein
MGCPDVPGYAMEIPANEAMEVIKGRRFLFVSEDDYDALPVKSAFTLLANRKLDFEGPARYEWWSFKAVVTYRGRAFGRGYLQFAGGGETDRLKKKSIL